MELVGIDLAAKTFDVMSDKTGHRIVGNNKKDISAWLKVLDKNAVLAMEATGNYFKLLSKLAHKKGFVVYVINARNLRHYAISAGRRAKTDKVDAAVILRFLQKECDEQHPWIPPTENQECVQDALKRRALLVKVRQSVELSCKTLMENSKALPELLECFDKAIKEMEMMAKSILVSERSTKEKLKLLKSIPGIGDVTALYLVNLFDRYSFSNINQLVSYVGLDLIFADSGQKRGRRRISKQGPSELRRLLFNGARSASLGQLSEIYNNYRERMNHTKAMVPMMRKILKLAYGVWKSGEVFDLNKFNSNLLKSS